MRRRNIRKNSSNYLADVSRRIRTLERKPVRTGVSTRAITKSEIVPATITPTEVSFGTPAVVPAGTTIDDYVAINVPTPKDGDILLVANEDTGTSQAHMFSKIDETYVPFTDPVARLTADGKGTIYRQDAEPTGGTYNNNDLWFDTNDSNKFYKYTSPAVSATVTNKVLTNNIATITTSAAHELHIRDVVTVTGVDSTFNGTFAVSSVPTTTTFTYEKTASNVSSVSSGGTISAGPWRAVAFGTNALGEIDASVVRVSNLDAGNISTGYLAADRIQANSLDVSVLQAGTLRAGTIYTGYVDANKINAGTINVALTITAGTIIGGQLSTNEELGTDTVSTVPRITILPTSFFGSSNYGTPTTDSVAMVVDSGFGDLPGRMQTFGDSTGTLLEIKPNAYTSGYDSRILLESSNSSGDTSGASMWIDDGSGVFIYPGHAKLTGASVILDGDTTVQGALSSYSVTSSDYSVANGLRGITASTAAASGGADGDVWLVYVD